MCQLTTELVLSENTLFRHVFCQLSACTMCVDPTTYHHLEENYVLKMINETEDTLCS